jgi:hypothetical protein
MQLWATIHSCEVDLERTKYKYNYVIVTNGEELSSEPRSVLHYLERSGKLKSHIHSDAPITPPYARQRAAEKADGKYLCFFDNHCLVGRQYFDRVMLDFERYDLDELHSTTRYYSGQDPCYHYHLRLEYNFWAARAMQWPVSMLKPYPIACGGHGGFIVKSDVWHKVGGYGPEGLLVGYAGEEPLFDLKMWRMGYKVHLDPKLYHYHYAGNRGYSRHYTDEYYTNLLASALVVGGEKWFYKVLDSFLTKEHIREGKHCANMYDLAMLAYNRSIQYAKELDAKSVMTLDELLVWFRQNDVAM